MEKRDQVRLPDRAASRAVLMGPFAGRIAAAITHPVYGGFDPDHCLVLRDAVTMEGFREYTRAATDTLLVFIGGSALPSDLAPVLAESPAAHKLVITPSTVVRNLYPSGMPGSASLLIAASADVLSSLNDGVPDEDELLGFDALRHHLMLTTSSPPVSHEFSVMDEDIAIARNPAYKGHAVPGIDSLPPDAVVLLGRASLLADGEPLTEELADAWNARDARATLVTNFWLTEDGHLSNPRARQMATVLFAEDPEPDQARTALRRHRVVAAGAVPQPQLTRDYWTTDDHLDYRPYAEAVAAFIRHSGSKPPLTIGIKGRWGAGKTSLMRMILAALDAPDEHGKPRAVQLTSRSRNALAKRRWWRRRKRPDTPVTNGEVSRSAAGTQQPQALGVEPPAEDWRPTVWFNPWAYQNSEQVWAGLAHAVISQVTDRLRPGDRERFWLKLNLARVDRLAVRRRVYRLLLERLAPFVLAFVLAAGTAAVLWLTGFAKDAGRWVLAGGTGAVLLGAAVRYGVFRGQNAAAGFGQLLSGPTAGVIAGEAKGLFDVAADPGYLGKAGFLHAVHTDMARVLDLVATEDRPLVVFVDDLDRCSPGVVAQVIEAVNLFLAGDFNNCVFVMAMEPDIVAAHVETAYADLAARVGGDGGELGWRFLEKIVQLPMGLPAIDPDTHVPRYLRALLGVPGAPVAVTALARPAGEPVAVYPVPRVPTGPVPAPAWLHTARQALRPRFVPPVEFHDWILRRLRSASTLENLDEAAAALRAQLAAGALLDFDLDGPIHVHLPPDQVDTIVNQAADRLYTELYTRSYTDDLAYNAIGAALPALGAASPREIKRYVNLFRFYSFIVAGRRAEIGADQIAKLSGLAIRWPDLLTTLTREDLLAHLERAAFDSDTRAGDDAWATAVEDAGLRAAQPRLAALREFLGQGPPIAEVARLIL
ncbi:KAP family P-loop NTPase fold protein [Actinokineospora sp. 24-640]